MEPSPIIDVGDDNLWDLTKFPERRVGNVPARDLPLNRWCVPRRAEI